MRGGRSDINETLDKSDAYKWTMLTADGIGLLGAYGAFKAAGTGARALRTAGVGMGDVSARALTVVQRRELALAFGLNSTRVGTRVIDRVVRQRLLDLAGGVLGVYSSHDGGVIRELVVWVIGNEGSRAWRNRTAPVIASCGRTRRRPLPGSSASSACCCTPSASS